MRKRGWFILGIGALLGIWLMVVGYEFLEKENALWQKKVKAAKEDQRRCEARYAKYRNFDQFRTSIRLPYASDLSPEHWLRQYDTLRAGMSQSEVEIIMGAPDYARCVLSEKSDKFLGSDWQYEVAVPQDVANGNQNSAVTIHFGPDGRLEDKHAMNLEPKPSPTPSATATPEISPSPMVSSTPSATPSATSQVTPSAAATPQ